MGLSFMASMAFISTLYLISILLLGSMIHVESSMNLKAKTGVTINSDKKSAKKLLTGLKPILLPHPDTAYLIEFVSDNCDLCDQMRPVIERLEEDLGTKVRRINIQRRSEFIGLLEAIGFDEGGNFPFYFNRRTGQAICGATTYMNLRRWGTGSLNHLFNDPPQTLQSQLEEGMILLRKF